MLRKLLYGGIFFVCVMLNTAANAETELAIVYPDVPAPYDQIFEEILTGIEQEFTGSHVRHSIKKGVATNDTLNWLQNEKPQMVITLGKRGYRIAKKLYQEKPVVVGALPIRPNGMSGISLLADPQVLFTSLKDLAPQIKSVHVVYSPNSRWLIEIAESKAKALGLTLKMTEVQNVKSALQKYDELLKNINAEEEAVWLPLDPVTANEQVILPKLLERSWSQNLVLFSSKPAHAKRGALFSMFPDHEELGRKLVQMVTSMRESNDPSGVKPLKDMKLAVNLRTAAHLGFEYKNQQKNGFHLTFPQ